MQDGSRLAASSAVDTRARPSESLRPAGVRARVAAIPAWGWLVALVCVSFAVRLVLALHLPGPWIFADEVAYADLSRSFVHSGTFEIRDVAVGGYSRVYPILIAPAYALFQDQEQAYQAAKAINALLVSLAAIPVYLLARRLVRPRLALVAAVLSLAIPSLFYSSVIMTESAFYPIFLTTAYVLVLVLERPTVLRQLALAVLLVVAYYTRAQALALVPAVLSATLLMAAGTTRDEPRGTRWRAFRSRLAAFWPIWLLVVLAGVAVIARQLAQGRPLADFFGVYSSVASADYSVGAVARWFLNDLTALDLSFGVVPFAAFLVVAVGLFARKASRVSRAFAAASLALVFWFLLVVALFSSKFSPRFEERLLFHLAPLLFVALMLWVERRRTGSVGAAAALVASLLVLAFPYRDHLNWDGVSDSFGLWPFLRLVEDGLSIGQVEAILVVCALALGLLFVLLRGRWTLVLPGILLVYFAVASAHVETRSHTFAAASLQAGIGGDRTWIDNAIGEGHAISIWKGDSRSVDWENEFFNRSLGRAYSFRYLGDSMPSAPLDIDSKTGLLLLGGKPIESRYAVAASGIVLRGQERAWDPVQGTRVYRLTGPLRLRELISGQYPDRYSGPALRYIRYGCRGGRLAIALTSNSVLAHAPQTVVARVDGRRVATAVVKPGAVDQALRVPLLGERGRCEVDFTVSPTVTPASVLGNGDTRELGVQFTTFGYTKPS